jgi:hypothetical protein
MNSSNVTFQLLQAQVRNRQKDKLEVAGKQFAKQVTHLLAFSFFLKVDSGLQTWLNASLVWLVHIVQ